MSSHDHRRDEVRPSPPRSHERAGAAAPPGLGLGNRAVQRLLDGSPQRSPSGREKVDESIARAIESKRGAGRTLDGSVRGELETALGDDFSDVRLHTDTEADRLSRAVAAEAFTTGSDVFFRSGRYDPVSTAGRTLLAHELTHVVQQRGAPAARELELTDPNEPSEQEAHAVAARLAAAPPGELVREPAEEPQGQVVQRLPTVVEFHSSSGLFLESVIDRPRARVVPVDQALAAYHALGSLTEANVATAKTKLDDLVAECDRYLADTTGKARRRGAVDRLRDEAVAERAVLGKLADAVGATTPDQRFAATAEAQDRQVRSLKSGRLRNEVADMDKWLTGALGQLRSDAAAMTRVLQAETQQLIDLRDDDDTPELTRQILREVLGNLARVEVREAILGPEAKFADPTNRARGYHVHHSLNAPLGTAERLASLTHELTHVSVSETFRNTSLFFAFSTGATDAEILALVEKRNARLASLEALMERDSWLTAAQKMLLRDKIQYPYKGPKGDISRYLTRFKAELGASHGRFMGLVGRGMNNTVIEFDTVVNQMMIYMLLWAIPEGNAFYRRLREVAQEAYDYRRAARGG